MTTNTNQVYCSGCGNRIDDNTVKFCSKCGKKTNNTFYQRLSNNFKKNTQINQPIFSPATFGTLLVLVWNILYPYICVFMVTSPYIGAPDPILDFSVFWWSIFSMPINAVAVIIIFFGESSRWHKFIIIGSYIFILAAIFLL